MMERLKPCPFCGGEARVKSDILFPNFFSVICLNEKCGAHVFFYGAERSRSENAHRWNRRAERSEE